MNVTLAIGMLVGAFIGFGCCSLWLTDVIRDLRYDLEVSEDELHRRDLEDKWNVFWESESDRLMRQHAGTPYIQGRDKYRVWDEDAA